jgi:hypothetical protein
VVLSLDVEKCRLSWTTVALPDEVETGLSARGGRMRPGQRLGAAGGRAEVKAGRFVAWEETGSG